MAQSAQEIYLIGLAYRHQAILSEAEYNDWKRSHPDEHATYRDILAGRALLEGKGKSAEETQAINEEKQEDKKEHGKKRYHGPHPVKSHESEANVAITQNNEQTSSDIQGQGNDTSEPVTNEEQIAPESISKNLQIDPPQEDIQSEQNANILSTNENSSPQNEVSEATIPKSLQSSTLITTQEVGVTIPKPQPSQEAYSAASRAVQQEIATATDGLKENIIAKKRAELEEKYKGQTYFVQVGGPGEGWNIPLANHMLKEFQDGKDRHIEAGLIANGQIKTELQRELEKGKKELRGKISEAAILEKMRILDPKAYHEYQVALAKYNRDVEQVKIQQRNESLETDDAKRREENDRRFNERQQVRNEREAADEDRYESRKDDLRAQFDQESETRRQENDEQIAAFNNRWEPEAQSQDEEISEANEEEDESSSSQSNFDDTSDDSSDSEPQQPEQAPQQETEEPKQNQPDNQDKKENKQQQSPQSHNRPSLKQGKKAAEKIGKQVAKRAGTQAAASGAGALAGAAAGGAGGAAAAGAGGAAAGAAGATAAGATVGLPIIAIIVGVILILLLLFLIVGGVFDGPNPEEEGLIPVTITKTVNKAEVPNPISDDLTKPDPSDVVYTLNVSYPGQAQDVVVSDPIPKNATFLKATGIHTTDKDASGKVLSVSWSLKANQSASTATTPSVTGSAKSIDITKYTQPPYSLLTPNGPSDITYTNQIMDNLNELGNAVARNQTYLTSKFDAKYVDPFLAVIWTGAIEGSYGNPYSWNCLDKETGNTINNGCAGGYKSGGWQVAGIQVSQAASHLAQDFTAVYGAGSVDNATKVQEIGQAVISASAQSSAGQITNPSTFPNQTISQLVSSAQSGDIASQQALAVLLMDRKLSAVIVALEVAGDISSQDNWRATMESWPGTYYSSKMQQFSNRMQAIAELYSGTSGSGGTSFASRTFTMTVRPILSDTYLINQTTARVIGAVDGKDGDGDIGTVTRDIAKLLPDPLPADSTDAEAVKQKAAILAHFQAEKSTLLPLYKEASTKSGIPWQVFAGIHWREGDATPGLSLTSGRPIGGYEPDRAASGDCEGPVGAVDGKADTNCAFADGVDDILFVANHLKGKIGKNPSNFAELVTALSRYNGNGNVNCNQTPYTYCPPLFDGEDSPYTLNFFDDRHSIMYMRYCLDGILCDYGTRDSRSGAATVIKWVAGSGL